MSENPEIQAPPVASFGHGIPGRAAPEAAYRTAFDLLAARAPREALEVIEPEDRGSMLHSLPEPTAGKTNLGALLRRAMRQDESA